MGPVSIGVAPMLGETGAHTAVLRQSEIATAVLRLSVTWAPALGRAWLLSQALGKGGAAPPAGSEDKASIQR